MYTGITPYLNSILDFYEERRKHTGQPNAFSNPLHVNMLREIIPAYEKMGWMKLSILKGSDGKDWAYQLDFVKDGIQYHYAPTFDMKYAAYSPSKILLFETIKSGFADSSLHEFNFMRGESDYKKQFAYAKTPFINLVVKNPYSTRNKIYNAYNKLSYLKLAFQKLTK
jgi:CelD/BcsL family acetyltransferase involved in cellulose biosynthesis